MVAKALLPCLFDRLDDDSVPLGRARERLRTLERERDNTDSPPTARRLAELGDRIASENATIRELDERVGAASISETLFREAVLRDLSLLFGTASLESTFDLTPYPQARSSVVNFGLLGLAGWHSSALSPESIQAAVRAAIRRFEPRVLADGMEVHVNLSGDDSDPNVLSIEIKGLLFADPVPRRLHLMSLIDLETGEIRIDDKPV